MEDKADVWSLFPLTFTDSITRVSRGRADAEPIYEGKHTM